MEKNKKDLKKILHTIGVGMIFFSLGRLFFLTPHDAYYLLLNQFIAIASAIVGIILLLL